MIRGLAWLLLVLPVGCEGTDSPRPEREWVVYAASMDGCYACDQDKPLVAKIEQLPGVVVVRITNEDRPLVRQFGIRIYPTYVVVRDGTTVYVGHSAAEVLAGWKGKK